MLARLFHTLRLALKSVMLHKLRSGLTMLGIVFGVFSVIAMLAIGEGASNQAQQQVLELGATNIIVRSIKPPEETSGSSSGNSFVLQYGLLRSDYDLVTGTIPTIVQSIPIREITEEARHEREALNLRVVGCTADYLELNHLRMHRGRFITSNDQHNMQNVAVLAFDAAKSLFGYQDPLGQPVKIGNEFYTVVGVTQARAASGAVGGSFSGQDYNNDVYIPLRTFEVRKGDLTIRRVTGSFSAERVELNQMTLRVRDRDDVVPTAEAIRETLQRTHGQKRDYSIIVPLELLKQADQIRQIFNIVLGSIAAISLVVGGIGIMNIMLATVTERTREIGIRRALGARRADIILQFLAETIVISGTGGLIGILLGLLTPLAFSGIQYFVFTFVMDPSAGTSEIGRMFGDMHPQIVALSLPIAFLISVAIGVVFGLYPAVAAARLDPIEALRHE